MDPNNKNLLFYEKNILNDLLFEAKDISNVFLEDTDNKFDLIALSLKVILGVISLFGLVFLVLINSELYNINTARCEFLEVFLRLDEA